MNLEEILRHHPPKELINKALCASSLANHKSILRGGSECSICVSGLTQWVAITIGIFLDFFLNSFLKFFGNFSGGFFWRNCFAELFWRNFFGGFFWENIFGTVFFGRILLGRFFGKEYSVEGILCLNGEGGRIRNLDP